MSKRLNPCRKCQPEGPTKRSPFAARRGWTRHDDRICAACRKDIPTAAESDDRLAAYRGRGA